MSRVFDAPKRLVFEAWTKSEYVQSWFTPAPLTTPACVVDARVGGVFRVVMRTPDGTEFPMDGRYTEIVPDSRIAWSAQIHDGLSVQTTVDFSEHEGKTTLDVHQIYAYESEATKGAHAGWTLTLNQLAEHLRSRA
jgi:uncharacterized protein YndB with AHSA1/START domain